MMAKFPDIVRIYQFAEQGGWVMLYETAANVQETDSGSENGGVQISRYVAYCDDNRVKFSTAGTKLDWSGFNKDFSDNDMNWHNIKKDPFNYERFGTVIYFGEVSN